MRKQTVRLKTGRGRRILLCLALCLLALATACACYRLFFHHATFTPPAFDPNAQQGVPAPDETLGYGSVSAPTGFSVGLCSTMYQQQDGSLLLYFTNPPTNEVNLRCEIRDESGTVLYSSGVIAPNEYIERLTPAGKLPNKAMQIEMSVYAYEPDTWYSKGTITLNNVLQAF